MLLDITKLTEPKAQTKRVDNDKRNIKSKKDFKLSSYVERDYLKKLGLDSEILRLNNDLVSQIADAHFEILKKYYDSDATNAKRKLSIIKNYHDSFLEGLDNGKIKEKTNDSREKEIDRLSRAYSKAYTEYKNLNLLLCDIITLKEEDGFVNAKSSKDITYDIIKNGKYAQYALCDYRYDKIINQSVEKRDIELLINNDYGTIYDYLVDFFKCAKVFNINGTKKKAGGFRVYSPESYRYEIDSKGNVSRKVPIIKNGCFYGFKDLETTRNDRIIGFIPRKSIRSYMGRELEKLAESKFLTLIPYMKVQINPYNYDSDLINGIAAVVRCEQDGEVFYRIDPLIERIESKGKKLLMQECEVSNNERKKKMIDELYRMKKIVKNSMQTSSLVKKHDNDLLTLCIGKNAASMPLKVFEQLVVTRYQILFNYYKKRVDNFTQKIESLKKLMDSQESEKEYISSNSTKNEIKRLEQLKMDCEKTQESLVEVYNLINPNFPNSRKYLHNLRAHLILDCDLISKEYDKQTMTLCDENLRLSKKVLSFITYTDDKNHVSNIKDRSISILPLISLGRFVDMQTESEHEVNVNKEGGVHIQGEGRKKKKVKGKNIVGFIKKEDIEKKGGISSFIKELKINPEDNGVLLIEGDVDEKLKNNDVYGKNVPLRYASELIRNLEPTMQSGDYLVTFTPNDDFGGHFVIEGIVKE